MNDTAITAAAMVTLTPPISATDYANIPWHARQRLNERLRRETRALTVELETLALARQKHYGTEEAQAVMAEAQACLAALPIDNQAAEHRLTLHRALPPNWKAA